jgi:GDPmannose 4,6-dehydratase
MPNPGKTALIFGVTGQDGALLAAALLRDGWTVHGGSRRGHVSKLWRLEELGLIDKINLVNVNLHEPYQIIEAITTLHPDHIYHLAAESFVADSFHQPHSVMSTNVVGTLNVLEAMRIAAPRAKLFFASSAEVFGTPPEAGLLDEGSALRPINPYGVSKLAAQSLVRVYRERYDLRATCGIMFNHESPLRARNFVTRKISYNLARLRLDGGPAMNLGAMDACRDWGAAADYVQAIPLTLGLDVADDFIFATGRKTSVREFLTYAATAAGYAPVFDGAGETMTCRDQKTGQALAAVSAKYFRPFDTQPLVGNPARLKQRTGFGGSRDVVAVAEDMVAADLQRRKNGAIHV